MGWLYDLQLLLLSSYNGYNWRSLKKLSHLSNVPHSTLYRVFHHHTKPSLETCLAILPFVASKSEGIKFIRKHYPNAFSSLDNLIGINFAK